MSPEGDINQAKAEPVEETTSALQNEYTSVNLARADFGVTPDQPITKPAADPYYVNNGDQPWKANPNNSFVPPADNKTSDPYFNPNASRPWRAKPFEDGGTQFRRPGDPVINPPVDQTDPRFRPQVLPNQSYVPDQQYLPQDQQFVPGFVSPNTQFNPQYSPEFNPQFISNNGVPAYSGMGFNFTNNFYNVGERPPLTFSGNMTVVPSGVDNIPVVKINTAFPGQQSFFGVPLNKANDGVVVSPTVITVPQGDKTLPVKVVPVKTVPVVPDKFEPGVVPSLDSKGKIPLVSNEVITNPIVSPDLTGVVVAEQTERVVVNPVVNTISSDLADPTKVASTENVVLPVAQTTNGVEVRPVTTNGDPTLIAQIPSSTDIPQVSNALVPIDQKTQDRATDVWSNIKNETYRGTTTTVAGLTWAFSNKLPRDNTFMANWAAKNNWTVKPDPNINWSAKLRDPAGAIVGVNAYQWTAGAWNWATGNQEWNSNSRVANVTIPAGILAYRALSPNAKSPGIAALVTAGTFGATYVGDSLVPAMKNTAIGTHTGFDDISMVTGMYAATKIPTPGALTRIMPAALGKTAPGLLWKAGILTGSFLGGNVIESGWNWMFGKESLKNDATSAMTDDGTTRTADSLTRARQKFSNLSDSQWSAAQAEYVKVKAETDAMKPGQDSPEKMSIADRKLLILAGAVGENYLNNGTQVTGQGNTFLGKGTDIDLNSKALVRLVEARNAAYRLIRRYNENVMPATINGTPVNKATEVAALTQEAQRLTGLIGRIYAPHDYEKALPEFLKAANEKPADFFTNYVKYNSDRAAADEQSLRSRGVWDDPNYREDRRLIAKTHSDKAFAIMVLAQRALDVNAGREAVELLRGLPGSNDPAMNARTALNAAITNFNQLPDTNPADIENMNRLRAMFIRLNAQIKAKFPTIYPNTP